MGIRSWLIDRLVGFLTEPLSDYEHRGWNDPDALQRHIRKGDVLLVEGDSRISVIIKYLTQSSWSHSAFYIGDELLRRGGELAEHARKDFGDEAAHLLVEALPQGVVASPLSKYIDFNIRLVRPHRLRAEHLEIILDEHVAAIGWRYDLRNIFDLARYLLPVSLIPTRLQRTALHFGSGVPTEVICSSLIGQIFQKVRFPILPAVEFPDGAEQAAPRRGWLTRLIFGYDSRRHTGIFHIRHPTLLTPRDFDLSPYFEIVKFNTIADERFDYTRIRWAREESHPAGNQPPRPKAKGRTGRSPAGAGAEGGDSPPAGPPGRPPAGEGKLPPQENAPCPQETLKSPGNSPRKKGTDPSGTRGG